MVDTNADMASQDSEDSICRYLDWDSEFFGRRIAQVSLKKLSERDLDRVVAWCGPRDIECVYLLAAGDDPETVRLAENSEFRLVDVRVTLEKRLTAREGTEPCARIRRARPEDLPLLRAIARNGHRHSRFYYDPEFPAERCDRLYEIWIEKSCAGYADTVLVAEINQEPIGYVSCHRKSETHGQIGLLAVGANWHASGIGRDLVASAVRWFGARGTRAVRVVTQGRNRNAQRLYQRSGFLTEGQELWYHRWFQK